MKKVITYGTYDLLHYGHVRLLERAKALGDYLIVGVTSDDFDKTRGKINVKQPLMERLEAVKNLGIADEIIVEEYVGQKIDDIKRYDVDIFTVGSDWEGYFDYLKEYCEVVYLDRTQGVSSTELRSQERSLKFGLVGEGRVLNKVKNEASLVNGLEVTAVFSEDEAIKTEAVKNNIIAAESYDALLDEVDAVYLVSHPSVHYEQIKKALEKGKHVLCESPIVLDAGRLHELYSIAGLNECILMDAVKTAYSTAYNRLLLLIKSGKMGEVLSVDATCTSLLDINLDKVANNSMWGSLHFWGPTALLPIFQLLGTDYCSKRIVTRPLQDAKQFDVFTKMDFLYPSATASIKVAVGAKSEGSLVVSGTEGYVYVPSPWWKTDYFEVRFEDTRENKRYFYQLDGEGIRYMLVSFVKAIENGRFDYYIERKVSSQIAQVMQDFEEKKDFFEI